MSLAPYRDAVVGPRFRIPGPSASSLVSPASAKQVGAPSAPGSYRNALLGRSGGNASFSSLAGDYPAVDPFLPLSSASSVRPSALAPAAPLAAATPAAPLGSSSGPFPGVTAASAVKKQKQLEVQLLNQKRFLLNYDPSDTISTIKAKIQEQEGISGDRQRSLIIEGKVLSLLKDDDRTMSHWLGDVKEGSKLTLLTTLSGGGPTKPKIGGKNLNPKPVSVSGGGVRNQQPLPLPQVEPLLLDPVEPPQSDGSTVRELRVQCLCGHIESEFSPSSTFSDVVEKVLTELKKLGHGELSSDTQTVFTIRGQRIFHSDTLIQTFTNATKNEVFILPNGYTTPFYDNFMRARQGIISADEFASFFASFRIEWITRYKKMPISCAEMESFVNLISDRNSDESEFTTDSRYLLSRLNEELPKLAISFSTAVLDSSFEITEYDQIVSTFILKLNETKLLHPNLSVDKRRDPQILDTASKDWEGVKKSNVASESGTIHSDAFRAILQAHWNPNHGLVDFGSGRGVVILLAAFWALIRNWHDQANPTCEFIDGVEIEPLSFLRSELLLKCGAWVANCFGMKWPNITMKLGDLKLQVNWITSAKFAFLNNCKFGEEEAINTNAMIFLRTKRRMKLVCFKYSNFKLDADCITCLQKVDDLGQWNGDSNVAYVLENCANNFRKLFEKLSTQIKEWIHTDNASNSAATVPATDFFVSQMVCDLAAYEAAMKKAFSECSSTQIDQVKRPKLQEVARNASRIREFIQSGANIIKDRAKFFLHEKIIPLIQGYNLGSFMYTPYVITAASLMLQLELTKDLLLSVQKKVRIRGSVNVEEEEKWLQILLQLLQVVPHETLPFCNAVSSRLFSTNVFQYSFTAESGARAACSNSNFFQEFSETWRHILSDQTRTKDPPLVSMKSTSAHPNHICLQQFAVKTKLVNSFQTILEESQLSLSLEKQESAMETIQVLLGVVRENAILYTQEAISQHILPKISSLFNSVLTKRKALKTHIDNLLTKIEEEDWNDSPHCTWLKQHLKYGFCHSDTDLLNEELWRQIQVSIVFLQSKVLSMNGSRPIPVLAAPIAEGAGAAGGASSPEAAAKLLEEAAKLERIEAKKKEKELAKEKRLKQKEARKKQRQKAEAAKKIQREAKKAAEMAQKALAQSAKDAAAAVNDICKPETWTSMVKDHNIQTDLSYFNYFKMALGVQQKNVDHMIQMHKESEDVDAHCPHFLKASLPRQNVYEQFVLLLPGHPQSNQSRSWFTSRSQSSSQGCRRLRNLVLCHQLANLVSGNEPQMEEFRTSDKHSSTILCANGSIYIVNVGEQRCEISDKLVKLKYTRKSYNISDIAVHGANHECSCSSQFHIRTNKMLICLTLSETPEQPSVVCDLTNGHKSFEDDAEKLVCESKYNDKTFQSQNNIRLIYSKQ
jgi:hypothetical protein